MRLLLVVLITMMARSGAVAQMKKASTGTVSAINLRNSSIEVSITALDGGQSLVRLFIDENTKVLVDGRLTTISAVSSEDSVVFIRDSNFLAVTIYVTSKAWMTRREKLVSESRPRDRQLQVDVKIPQGAEGRQNAKTDQVYKQPDEKVFIKRILQVPKNE